jgi:alginate O-acetyltransferase complex protein AlgJ
MILRGEQDGQLNGAVGEDRVVEVQAAQHAAFTPARFVQDGKVIRGKDGWLFLAGDTNDVLGQHTGELLLEEETLERWRLLVESRRMMLSEIGASYLFVVAPDTHAIYPEKLPDGVQPVAERPIVQLCDHLERARSPVQPIYLLGDLRRARGNRLVCFPVDTHWNEYGAFVGYSRIADEIEETMPIRRIDEDELLLFEAPMVGDLSYKLEPGRYDTMTFAFVRNGSATVVEDNRVEGTGSVLTTVCPDATGTCLLVGDSYGWGMVKPLAESFRNFTFLHMATFDRDFIAALEPDVVVNLVAERFLIDVPTDEGASTVESRIAHKRRTGSIRDSIFYWAHTKSPSVESVERMRAALLSRGHLRDVAILSLLAYAGLRPDEIVSLRWRQIEEDHLNVVAATKPWRVEGIPVVAPLFKRYRLSHVSKRVVPLVPHLAEDLERWRRSLDRPPEPDHFLFAEDDGRHWARGRWRAWRSQVFRPLAIGAGLRSRIPYDARHVISILLINAGVTPKELGRILGTTTQQVTSDYAAYFYLASMGPPVSVADQIDRARGRAAPSVRVGIGQ